MLGDEGWKRHANPWSVWTRFAAIPAMIVAVWSRVWLSWWALAPVGLVMLWLVLNPFVFSPVSAPRRWVEKGIYGEQLWLSDKSAPTGHRAVLRWLIVLGLAGMAVLTYGLVALLVWPTVFGATLLSVAQLWRIDRFSLLFEERQRAPAAQSP
jgi:hypothetical protein